MKLHDLLKSLDKFVAVTVNGYETGFIIQESVNWLLAYGKDMLDKEVYKVKIVSETWLQVYIYEH